MKSKIAVVLSLIMAALFVFTGCGNKTDPQSTLYIEIDNAGYGIEWIDPIIDMFEESHPGITVRKTFMTKAPKSIIEKITSGTSHLDLIFVETNIHAYVDRKISANGQNYDSPFEDLTDLYESTVPGEEVKYKDKMIDAWYEYSTVDVNEEKRQYSVPWIQSLVSFILNKNVYKDEFGPLPNTTDEMFAFFDAVKEKGVTPMLDTLADSYLVYMYELWMAQYNGSENMKKIYQGYAVDAEKDANGNLQRYVPEIFLNDGLYEALKVTERLTLHTNGYLSSKKTLGFTEAQNVFLEGKDNILFMPNGLWLEREMSANFDPDELNIEFVKVPVVSALGEKLGITDQVLSAIIDYVDGTTQALPAFSSTKGFTNDEVVAAVTDARTMNTCNYTFGAMVSSYSTKKDLAKDFLRLLATDKGIEGMLAKTGVQAPFKYDIQNSAVKDSMSQFTYSGNKLINEGKFYFSQIDNLYLKNSLLNFCYPNSGNVISNLGAISAQDRKTADTLYSESYRKMQQNWATYLTTAGISK